MIRILMRIACVSLIPLAACLPVANERNAFLTLTESLGVTANTNDNGSGGGGDAPVPDSEFRRMMTLTLANNHPTADLNTSLVMWVNTNSIRSAEQQDALLRNGYVQLTREVRLGTSFTLPPGTFVFNGPGVAGATSIRIGPAAGGAASVETFTIVTPDTILVFSQPPVSCDSVAFFYTIDGEVLNSDPVGGGLGIFGGATGTGGLKTLAQINVYQCQPLKPGLFLKLGGGTRAAGEFFEGEDARFDFFNAPTAAGDFATVTFQ